MDLDRFLSVYRVEYVSYFPKRDSSDPPPPQIIYEECTPHPIFYLTEPASKCNWKSCPYITPMPQKYPYITEALKTDPPRDLLQIDRDYHKALNQIGYCRMKRSCAIKVPKNMMECYKLVCKPFMCPETTADELDVEKDDVKSSKEDSPIHHHVQGKPNAISGSNKDQMEPKLLRKYTEAVSQTSSPPFEGISEYSDIISRLGDRLLP
ncbi:uncharacterized protein LOC108739665 [Agrilus planipennis]|uniref:Uncharacterized protein LOC108739665 n=1 Tax=Agrilus planipennis TaxID=224129 RepID=A0A1W4X8K2_AGRPL|nr:uncharacterized protein LOC108739665 [Agrilus planipennis]